MSALPGISESQGGHGRTLGSGCGVLPRASAAIAADPFCWHGAANKDYDGRRLMGTAAVVDATQTGGTFYSPRQVGSSLVDAVRLDLASVPDVVGATPKADLGDGTNWSGASGAADQRF